MWNRAAQYTCLAVPGHQSLSHVSSLNLFSLHICTCYPVSVHAERLNATSWWDLCVCKWHLCQLLESGQGCRCPTDCGASCKSEWRSLSSAMGQGSLHSQTSDQGEWGGSAPPAGAGPQVTAWGPGASGGARAPVSSPAWDVCLCICLHTLSWTSQQVVGPQGYAGMPRETCRYSEPEGWVCEYMSTGLGPSIQRGMNGSGPEQLEEAAVLCTSLNGCH